MNAVVILVSFLVFCFCLVRSKPPVYSTNSFTKDDPRLAHIPVSPNGRFVCAPRDRKPNYYSPSKKFYYFRKGEKLPDHLLLIRVPENTIACFSDVRLSEAKEALQKPPLPSRMEQKCSVRLFLTTPECAVFLPIQ